MKLLLSALEPSSNLHAKEVIFHIAKTLYKQGKIQSKTSKEIPPKIEIIGIFDKYLQEQILLQYATSAEFRDFIVSNVTFSPLFCSQDFSIMGFVDVVKKIPFLLKARKCLLKSATQVDKILFLDSSSFHIPLAKKIKAESIKAPIYYYILPQVWAWKQWRTKVLECVFDRLLAILPFEVDYYSAEARNNQKVRFVGHPLLDELDFEAVSYREKQMQTKASAIKEKNNTGQDINHIVFMPGSRQGEIKRIFPTFVQVAQMLQSYQSIKEITKNNTAKHTKHSPKIILKTLVIPAFFAKKTLSELESIYGNLSDFKLSFDAQKSLKEADFAFICSGTATLQAALLATPFVLCYKVARLDYFIARAFVKLKYIGLANIFYNALCGEPAGRGESKMHQELIQEDMNAQNLICAYNKEIQRAENGHFIACAKALWEYLSTNNCNEKNNNNDDKILNNSKTLHKNATKIYRGSAQNVANMLLMD